MLSEWGARGRAANRVGSLFPTRGSHHVVMCRTCLSGRVWYLLWRRFHGPPLGDKSIVCDGITTSTAYRAPHDRAVVVLHQFFAATPVQHMAASQSHHALAVLEVGQADRAGAVVAVELCCWFVVLSCWCIVNRRRRCKLLLSCC